MEFSAAKILNKPSQKFTKVKIMKKSINDSKNADHFNYSILDTIKDSLFKN